MVSYAAGLVTGLDRVVDGELHAAGCLLLLLGNVSTAIVVLVHDRAVGRVGVVGLVMSLVERRQPDDREQPRHACEQCDAPPAIAEFSQGRGNTTAPPTRITCRYTSQNSYLAAERLLRSLTDAAGTSRLPWRFDDRNAVVFKVDLETSFVVAEPERPRATGCVRHEGDVCER